MRFTHETLPQRVVFAAGESPAAVAAEIEALGGSKVMLIASGREKELADPIAKEIPVVLRHEEVVMHVPVEVAGRALRVAVDADADILVSVGGGSTTGLAKAIALSTGLPIVAVPTTYAGSEATNVWGLTEGETKTTGVDNKVLPASVVYDAALLTTLPGEMTVASGLNAMAHCVDSMWGPRADPLDRALAQEGIRALATGLPGGGRRLDECRGHRADPVRRLPRRCRFRLGRLGDASQDLPRSRRHVQPPARTDSCGRAALRTGLQRPARPRGGGTYRPGLRHGLPHRGGERGLTALRQVLDAPKALRDYGMPEDGIAKAVGPITKVVPANNPAPVTDENLTALLRAAWAGAPIG